MKKKIILISSFFESPFHSNRAPYNEQLFLALKSNFDIRIIRPIAWTDIYHSSVQIPKQDYYRSEWNGISVFYPTYYYLPRIALSTNGRMYYYSIQKSFKTINTIPDIFYTTWAYPDAYATMLLAQKYNKKYIVRVHGSDINDLVYRNNIKTKVKQVLNNASAIISPSVALKEKMIELDIPKDKIHVIYSGIDKNKFFFQERAICETQLSLKPGKKRILYIGNFKKAKGVFDLLKATKLLKDELDNFEVLFIGTGEDHALMKQFITDHKLENYTQIMGSVDHHLLNSWINSSDCVCLPSYAEGLPNVLLEALACKTNIVATGVGGIPEIIKDASDYLVKPGAIVPLKNTLLRILNNRTNPTEAAIPIRTYTEIAQQITGIIDQLLN